MTRFRLVGWSVPLLAFVATAAGIATAYLLRPHPAPSAAPERLADCAPEMPRWEWCDARPDIGRVTEARRRVARQVVDGSLPLVDAAATMRRIDRRSPHFRWEAFRAFAPQASDAELHCREVVFWVEHVLPRGREADELLGRLESEIECRRQCDALTLPDDTDPPGQPESR